MKKVSALLLLAGCATMPRPIDTRSLPCHAMAVVTTRQPETTSEISGIVYANDPKIPIDAASVYLRPLGGGDALATAKTDAEGRFSFPLIPDGWYQIETCSEGMNPLIVAVHVTRRAAAHVIEIPLHVSA